MVGLHRPGIQIIIPLSFRALHKSWLTVMSLKSSDACPEGNDVEALSITWNFSVTCLLFILTSKSISPNGCMTSPEYVVSLVFDLFSFGLEANVAKSC